MFCLSLSTPPSVARPRYFFTYLLPHQAPPGLTHLVDHIMNSTGEDERASLRIEGRGGKKKSRKNEKEKEGKKKSGSRLRSCNDMPAL